MKETDSKQIYNTKASLAVRWFYGSITDENLKLASGYFGHNSSDNKMMYSQPTWLSYMHKASGALIKNSDQLIKRPQIINLLASIIFKKNILKGQKNTRRNDIHIQSLPSA